MAVKYDMEEYPKEARTHTYMQNHVTHFSDLDKAQTLCHALVCRGMKTEGPLSGKANSLPQWLKHSPGDK